MHFEMVGADVIKPEQRLLIDPNRELCTVWSVASYDKSTAQAMWEGRQIKVYVSALGEFQVLYYERKCGESWPQDVMRVLD